MYTYKIAPMVNPCQMPYFSHLTHAFANLALLPETIPRKLWYVCINYLFFMDIS